MQELAGLTIFFYVFAFVLTFGVIGYWAYRRSRRRAIPGEEPPRHIDDREDRIA